MKKILVIEDEAAVRENITELLRAEGYVTVEARDGEEGLQMVWEEQPDLILCDIRMPRLDGYGVLARLNQDDSGAVIPFIFLTARTERRDMRMGMNLGAEDYITKPYTRNDILEAVKRRLDKRELLTHRSLVKLEEIQHKLSYSLPHELLTPLSIIMSRSELLFGDKDLMNDAAQIRDAGKDIRDASGRLLRLIQTYLDYAEFDAIERDEKQKSQFFLQRVEFPDQLIQEISASVSKDFHRVDDLKISVEKASVVIPEDYLLRIVECMVENAMMQSSAGTTVELVAKVLPGRDYYLISMQNVGRNFTENEILEINGQITNTGRKYEIQGIVIKLIYIRRIVHYFNGRFLLQNRPESGNQVDIYLPYLSA